MRNVPPSSVGNSDSYAYLNGINTFENPEAVNINVFATTGINFYDHSSLVNQAMSDATLALLAPDLTVAEKVIAADDVIDQMQHDLDARTITLIARQQPVASDLRTLVTSLRMSGGKFFRLSTNC